MNARYSFACFAWSLIFASALSACSDTANGGTVDAPTDGPVGRPDAPDTTRFDTCAVTPGDDRMVLRGTVLTPTEQAAGEVAIDNGVITCVAATCPMPGATIVDCGGAVISPGLINTHDHITFTQNLPYTPTAERYEHRHDWRRGLRGHTEIDATGGASSGEVSWGELRFVLGGATSIVGSGGASGLLRNLDQANNQEGLGEQPVEFETFPLGDSNGALRNGDCNYGSAVTDAEIANLASFEPHIAEGIDAEAHNEYFCMSSGTYDTTSPGVSYDLIVPQTAMIHGVGLRAADYAEMARDGTALIWSPRSNITLYGDTARVTIAKRAGVQIALGTDWMPTGSMNLLRELQCAREFNATYLQSEFSDRDLWQMVTANAADVVGMSDRIGVLAVGREADIAIFAGSAADGPSAIVNAEPRDVILTLRSGRVLAGNADVVAALEDGCDTISVCDVPKRACVMRELGISMTSLEAAAAGSYAAALCGAISDEPLCMPSRMASVGGSSIYTGVVSATDADGDGVPNASDLCPNVFDPIRPVDAGSQPDPDGDGLGDACDPCPLDVGTTCSVPDPNDADGDMVPNAADNCPGTANTNQADGDADGKGDVCDACPTVPNPGGAACPGNIYEVKRGTTPVGTVVRLSALVTGKGNNGFTLQVKDGDPGYMGPDYSGIFVFTGTGPLLANAAIGARVSATGTVTDFFGQIELATVTAVDVDAAGPEAPPAPEVVTMADIATGGARATTLEGVVVQVGAVTVTAQNTMFNEFTISDGVMMVSVDDFLTPFTELPMIGTNYSSVTGVLLFRFAESKIEPRSAADLAP